jgi:hypothetical protein
MPRRVTVESSGKLLISTILKIELRLDEFSEKK